MTAAWMERALLAVAAAATLYGAIAMRAPRPLQMARASAVALVPLAPARPTTDSLASALDAVTAENLFRADRAEPDDVPAAPAAFGALPPAASLKPRLVLRGIVGGPPWDAVIEGIPGVEGAAVLREGQERAGITVRSIRRDTVTVRGSDTTWKLTIQRVW